MKSSVLFVAVLALIVSSGVASAEDLTGVDKILCAGVQATYCDTSGACEVGMPWQWNMPEFVEIDLEAKMVSTTKAVERFRQTPIRTLERANGEIYLQGVENARAFSFVIDEASGVASIAIAADGMTISVFAACTPMPSGR
jgi:hypothetical protein